MPNIVKSTRGCDKLVDDSNFIYRQERKYVGKVYWKRVDKILKIVHINLNSEVIFKCKIVSAHTSIEP